MRGDLMRRRSGDVRMGFFRHLFFFVAVGVTCLSGCAPSSVATRQESPPSAQATRTLRLGMRSETATGLAVFNTRTSNQEEAAWMFHAGLTAQDAQGDLQGRLARKVPSIADGDWRVLPDGSMDVTWKLRPNVKWHDGTVLTADDFVFGIQVARDPDLPLRYQGGVNLIREVTAPDAETLVVRWSEPYYGANQGRPDDLPAVPRHIMQTLYQQGDKAAFTNSPYWTTEFVGLGPYRLGKWLQGSFTEGLAFDDYFLGRPKIDRVILRYFNDLNVMVASLLADDIDMVPSSLSAQNAEPIRGEWQQRGTILQWASDANSAQFQYRDPAAPWVGDVRIRQALVHLVDRQTIAETFEPGGAGPVDLLVAPHEPVYRLVEQRGFARYPYDPARATTLLAEAGWSRGADGTLQNLSGQRFAIEVRVNAIGSDAALALADQWKRGGMEVPFTAIPNNAADRQKQRAQSQGVMLGGRVVGLDNLLVQYTTAEIRSEENNWLAVNQGGYSNPFFDRLYAQYSAELDPAKRNSVYAEFIKLMADQALAVPTYYTTSLIAFRRGISGPTLLQPLQVATWNVHDWTME